MKKNKATLMLPYLHALKFLYRPFVELVNLEKNELVAEIESTFVHPHIYTTYDAFKYYFDVFIFFQREVNAHVFIC